MQIMKKTLQPTTEWCGTILMILTVTLFHNVDKEPQQTMTAGASFMANSLNKRLQDLNNKHIWLRKCPFQEQSRIQDLKDVESTWFNYKYLSHWECYYHQQNTLLQKNIYRRALLNRHHRDQIECYQNYILLNK